MDRPDIDYCGSCGPRGCLCDWQEERDLKRLMKATQEALAAGVTLEEIRRVVAQ